jgi:hypothetical protein
MKVLIERLFRSSANRYFWFGMRYGVKFQAAFAREIALEQGMEYVRHDALVEITLSSVSSRVGRSLPLAVLQRNAL